MAFSNFTAMPAYKKSIARVFARSKFSDIECDLIETTQKIPTTGGFVQIFTADGGMVFTPKRTASKLSDQQRGNVKTIQDTMEFTLELTVAQTSLDMLQDVMIIDPSASGVKTFTSFKQNLGADITNSAVSFVIYDKNFDATNDTNNPTVTADAETIVLYKCVPSEIAPIELNAKQGTAKLTFDCLVSSSTGGSSGSAGQMGAFTAA